MYAARPAPNSAWARYLFYSRQYLKYGLLHDDCFCDSPVMKEAIRRLPKKIQDERNFRMLYATQLNIGHQVLPKEKWTKLENDVRYLQPYIEEVEAELKEKQEWYKTH